LTDLPILPLRIGFDRARIVRSALVLFVVATIGGMVLVALQRARPSALGQWLGARSVGPVPLLLVVVEGLALLVVAVAVWSAWQRRDYIVLRDDGIEFHNYLGVFLVAWENVARLELASAGYVGIQLRDRTRLVATHKGTAEQQERLATLEPISAYDLILHPEQLPCGVEQFVAWVTELGRRAEAGRDLGG
jgi:hypothetical protein